MGTERVGAWGVWNMQTELRPLIGKRSDAGDEGWAAPVRVERKGEKSGNVRR